MEPWGRYATGIAELVAVALLLNPRTAVLGAVLTTGLMGGAIMSHLTKLGIEVQGDGGLLFGLAVTVLLLSAIVIVLRRRDLPFVGALFQGHAADVVFELALRRQLFLYRLRPQQSGHGGQQLVRLETGRRGAPAKRHHAERGGRVYYRPECL